MLDRKSWEMIRYFTQAYPRRSVLMVVCLLCSGFLEGLSIAALLPLLDVLMEGGSGDGVVTQLVARGLGVLGLAPSLGWLLLLMLLAMTLKSFALWIAMRQVGYTIAHVAAELRLSLIRSLMKVKWAYFSSQPAGKFAHAISIEAFRASNAYYEVAIGVACFVQIVVYVTAAMIVSWQVALLAMFFGAAMMYALRGLIHMTRQASFQQNETGKSLVIRLADALQGIKPIKAMAREDELAPLLEAETRELNLAQRRVILAKESLKALQEPLMLLALAVGVYVAIRWVDTPLSALMILAFLFYRLASRASMLQQAYQKMAEYEAGFWSFRESVIKAERDQEQSAGAQLSPSLQQGIAVENVTFGYAPDQPVLRNICLQIPADSFVAFEGPSGAGKSTLADMLIGLVRPHAGAVRVDGIDLKDLDLHAWRRMVGYVPQEMFLFHDTVYQNIALNDSSIGREAVESALRAAGAWDFVSALPDGLETVLGERGSRISGGERQRIALARALVCRPRLLVLDEVTTALDPVTERAICETLQRLSGQITIVAISHQPAVLAAADRVYRLANGVVEMTGEKA